MLNAYCDFCAAAHSKFKVRWIYLSNTCWRKINFYDKWCDACLDSGLCGQPPERPQLPPEHYKVLVTLDCLGLSCSVQGRKQHLTIQLSCLPCLHVSLQNAHAEILPLPKMMVLGSRAFGGCLSHEGGVLLNGISALIKETPESSLILYTMRGHSEMVSLWTREKALIQLCWHLDVGLPELQD